jgi:hypothetical protein
MPKLGLSDKVTYNYYGRGGWDPERVMFGGNLGMNFVKRGYQFYISPIIGYRITDRFHMGFDLGYSYYQEKFDYTNSITLENETYRYIESSYNTDLFARLFLLRPIFLQVQPGVLFDKSFEEPNFSYDRSTGKLVENTKRIMIPTGLVGAGFVIPFEETAALIIQGLYDVLQNPLSPYYGLPIIRGGFTIGLY